MSEQSESNGGHGGNSCLLAGREPAFANLGDFEKRMVEAVYESWNQLKQDTLDWYEPLRQCNERLNFAHAHA